MKIKTIYVPMVADLIHPGHLNIIKIAAELGEVIVGLFSDKAVASYKRVPYLNYEQRKQIVENIKGVSKVVIQDEKDYEPNLRKYKPDYMVHGTDWQEGPLKAAREKAIKTMAEWGGIVIEPEYTKGVSSSDLHKHKNKFGITPANRIKNLNKLLSVKSHINIAGVYDDLSTTIIENAKYIPEKKDTAYFFDGILFNIFNNEENSSVLIDNTSILFTLNSILEITNKPIFYNASNINVKDVPFIVKRMERLGVSAIITESSGNNTIELITEIKETRKDDNFLIVTKIYLRNTIDDVVSYIKTGADIILIDLTEWNWTEILKFCNSYNTIPNRKYLAAIISDEFLSFENKLKELNVNIFIYYDQLYKGAISGMEKASAEILKNF